MASFKKYWSQCVYSQAPSSFIFKALEAVKEPAKRLSAACLKLQPALPY